MEKVVRKVLDSFSTISIKASLIFHVIACLVIALALSLTSSSICQYGQNAMHTKYLAQFEKEHAIQGHIVGENGLDYGGNIIVYRDDILKLYSSSELALNKLLDFLNVALVPTWFIVSIIVTCVLFYRKKLKQPLEILDHAADNIANNNLDFTIQYPANDEMGKLCASFEKMRATLQANNSKMWRQMEDRKRLNAVFSHDLRTPLTVLKGYTDMLCKYAPGGQMTRKKVAQTATTMSEHVARLENYVNEMSRLQKLEDIEIATKTLDKSQLLRKFTSTANILCAKQKVTFNDLGTNLSLCLDEHVTMEIFENLLSNAARYAKEFIAVNINTMNGFLNISVSDDGCGFDKNTLANATTPFYKAKENVYDNHFGMGLSICKILAKKHGGDIIISNNPNGGANVLVKISS